jgi:hypothetical protein
VINAGVYGKLWNWRRNVNYKIHLPFSSKTPLGERRRPLLGENGPREAQRGTIIFNPDDGMVGAFRIIRKLRYLRRTEHFARI